MPIELMLGSQDFDRSRTPLPIASSLLLTGPPSTLRLRLRTRRTGVVIGCQNTDTGTQRPARSLPVVYVGRSGKLLVPTSAGGVDGPSAPVNDGAWHHVVIVRTGSSQSLYVDGALIRSIQYAIPDGLDYCQAGIGFTTGWPDTNLGWVAFTGQIEGLRVYQQAWTQEQVMRDWSSSPGLRQ